MPVPFFDKKENTPGNLSTILATDADYLHGTITGLCSVFFINLSNIGISLFIGISQSWQLALVVIILSPLMILYGSINQALIKNITLKSQ